jgi:hypothetical protein
MAKDWNDIRANRHSPMTPPPEWPPTEAAYSAYPAAKGSRGRTVI